MPARGNAGPAVIRVGRTGARPKPCGSDSIGANGTQIATLGRRIGQEGMAPRKAEGHAGRGHKPTLHGQSRVRSPLAAGDVRLVSGGRGGSGPRARPDFAVVTKNIRGDQVGWHRLPGVLGHRGAEVSGSRTVPPLRPRENSSISSVAGWRQGFVSNITNPKITGKHAGKPRYLTAEEKLSVPAVARNGDCR
jgi:hypothetical protein